MAKGIEITGRLIMRRVNVGSKSEMDGFFIVTADGKEEMVSIEGENPFDQPTLRGLVGKIVSAKECVFYRYQYLAETVTHVP